MISGLIGVVVCVLLLGGCGGGPSNLVREEPIPAACTAPVVCDNEESLTEELSAKRLEELYAKSGIPGWDPSLEKS